MAMIVTTGGHVTIPKPVREQLGIVVGSKVEFLRTADGSVVIMPVDARPARKTVSTLRGHAGEGLSTDEIMALTRGEEP